MSVANIFRRSSDSCSRLTTRFINPCQCQALGFTLIELMVALAIFGILLAAGIPGLTSLSNNMAATSTTNRLVNALAYARNEAVSRVANISICPSNDGSTCSGTWDNGWIIYINVDGSGTRVVANDELLRTEDISSSSAVVTSVATSITFDRYGESTAGANVNLSACGADDNVGRSITVSTIGFTSVDEGVCP